jgi:hypothetical protein
MMIMSYLMFGLQSRWECSCPIHPDEKIMDMVVVLDNWDGPNE